LYMSGLSHTGSARENAAESGAEGPGGWEWQVFGRSTPLSHASRALRHSAASPPGDGSGSVESPEKIMAAQRPAVPTPGGKRPGSLEENSHRRGTRARLAELFLHGPKADPARGGHGLDKIPRAMLLSPHASLAGPGCASEALSSLQPLRPVAQLPMGSTQHAEGRECQGAGCEERRHASRVCSNTVSVVGRAFAAPEFAPIYQREIPHRQEQAEHEGSGAKHLLQTPTPGGPQTPSLTPSSLSVASNSEEGSSVLSAPECIQLVQDSQVAGDTFVQVEMQSWIDGDGHHDVGEERDGTLSPVFSPWPWTPQCPPQTPTFVQGRGFINPAEPFPPPPPPPPPSTSGAELAQLQAEHVQNGIDLRSRRALEDSAVQVLGPATSSDGSCIVQLVCDIHELTDKMTKRFAVDGWRHLASRRQCRHGWIEKIWSRKKSLRNAKRVFNRLRSYAQERISNNTLQTLALQRICSRYAQDRQTKRFFFLQWSVRAHDCAAGHRSGCAATRSGTGLSFQEAEARLRALDTEREQLIEQLRLHSGRCARKMESSHTANLRDEMLLRAVRLRSATAKAAVKRLAFEVWNRHTSVLCWTHGRLRLASHKCRVITIRGIWVSLLHYTSHARSKRFAVGRARKRGETLIMRRAWMTLLGHIIDIQLQQSQALSLEFASGSDFYLASTLAVSPSPVTSSSNSTKQKMQDRETDEFCFPAQDANSRAEALPQCMTRKSMEANTAAGCYCAEEAESCKRALFPDTGIVKIGKGDGQGGDQRQVRDLLRRQIQLSQLQAGLINKLRGKVDRQALEAGDECNRLTTAPQPTPAKEQSLPFSHARSQLSMMQHKKTVDSGGVRHRQRREQQLLQLFQLQQRELSEAAAPKIGGKGGGVEPSRRRGEMIEF